jgi:hypothetical protein
MKILLDWMAIAFLTTVSLAIIGFFARIFFEMFMLGWRVL